MVGVRYRVGVRVVVADGDGVDVREGEGVAEDKTVPVVAKVIEGVLLFSGPGLPQAVRNPTQRNISAKWIFLLAICTEFDIRG